MNAGKLRYQVALKEKTVSSKDAVGGEVTTYVTRVLLWADCEFLRMREYIAARAGGVEVSLRVTTRYYPGIRPEWRVSWDDAMYDIAEVLPDYRAGSMTLMCVGPVVAVPGVVT